MLLGFVEAARFWSGQPFATTRTKSSQYQNATYSPWRRYSVGAMDFHGYLLPRQPRAKYFTTEAANSL
jgi:hypothetical protein